jgi:hypothetical protein
MDKDFSINKLAYEERTRTLMQYADYFRSIPLEPGVDAKEPHWKNDEIPPMDAAMIYGTLVQKNPRFYVECGSGNTTKFAARANRDHKLSTKIISIDPHPRAEIDMLCDQIFRIPFEEMDLSFFRTLTADDIFLIDCSHRAFPNSDVTVFFTEVLPILPKGCLYAIHDIWLPYEVFVERLYNEQYMLATYIIGGMMKDKIYFPSGYILYRTQFLQDLDRTMPLYTGMSFNNGSFFWVEKG